MKTKLLKILNVSAMKTKTQKARNDSHKWNPILFYVARD